MKFVNVTTMESEISLESISSDHLNPFGMDNIDYTVFSLPIF